MRRWYAAATCAIAVSLLVLAIIPFKGIECRIEYRWAAPASPPPPGTWAGQTNNYGFRFNRYSNGSGYGWVPIWPITLPPIALAIVLARRRLRWIVVAGLLPLVLTFLCARSLVVVDFIGWDSDDIWRGVRSSGGQMTFLKFTWLPSKTRKRGEASLDYMSSKIKRSKATPFVPEFEPRPSNLFGFGEGSITRGILRSDAIAVPYWPFILFSLIPVIFLLRREMRVRRRVRMNQCLTCGYDLRQSPDRCPECGASGARLRPQGAASSAA
jgi:hypothetical protein